MTEMERNIFEERALKVESESVQFLTNMPKFLSSSNNGVWWNKLFQMDYQVDNNQVEIVHNLNPSNFSHRVKSPVLQTGDKVKVLDHKGTLEQMQEGHGAYTEAMELVLGRCGYVLNVRPFVGCKVEFELVGESEK